MKTLDDLASCFISLKVGIGPTSAKRLVSALLNSDDATLNDLAQKISNLHKNVKHCTVCGVWSETDVCETCSDPSRDKTILCVTDKIEDVNLIKKVKDFRGVFHVLGSTACPAYVLNGKDESVNALVERVKRDNVKEIVFATGPAVERSGIPTYVKDCLKDVDPPVSITRLAVGIPIGSTLDDIDQNTITSCLTNRQAIF